VGGPAPLRQAVERHRHLKMWPGLVSAKRAAAPEVPQGAGKL